MQVERHLRSTLRATLSICVALFIVGCERLPEVVIHVPGGTEVHVPVELAVTSQERARGLMYRRDLPSGAGMLFVFPETADHSFWMKNTPLPLDMIFISEDLHVVGIVESTVPFSTRPLRVDQPSRYVLEVHAGFAARKSIASGARVEFRNFRPAAPQP